jgi:RimJ/RimL family protein N-acetyltransferase
VTTADDPGSATTMLIEGTPLRIRPIRPDDTPALITMHHSLSTRTVYQRFFAILPELSQQQADHFTHVDGSKRFALVAEEPDGSLVAVGRYDRLAPDFLQAEVAVVVADRYQNHGLGTALVRMLRAHAREAGVVAFVADVLSTNRALHRAFRDAGLVAMTDSDHGVAHLVMPLS